MNNKVLRLILIISFIGSLSAAKSQNYASMLKQPATWHVTFCQKTTCFTDFYSSQGDTTIDGKWYRFLVDFHFNKAVVVREDTVTGKVYFRYLYGQRKDTDVLMYDYSLNLNESIYIFNPNSPIPEDSLGLYDVVRVDSINTEKGYRKRIKLNRHDQTSNEFSTTTWVEGIGGLSYINTPAVGPELYGFGELSCFAFNDTDFVYKSIFSKEKSDCNINFVVKEEDTLRIIENEKSRVKVFPNPARNTIFLDGLSGHQVLVIIQDNIGRVVLENNTSNGEIDISFLERGVYFISLYSEEQELYSQKILKH